MVLRPGGGLTHTVRPCRLVASPRRARSAGGIHHTDAGSQYTSDRFAEGLVGAGVAGSIGSVGDSYDNACAETINGLCKTELIKPRTPWKSVEQVEYGTAEWVDWFNHCRPYEYCGDIPPAEVEAAYYASKAPHHQVAVTV
ncbi:hypothetical protein TPB0596_10280 [Tsukamurella pulmonis]|nr:hypothetical protein TPB0596_10280 [Tsukamurella pulmonis]